MEVTTSSNNRFFPQSGSIPSHCAIPTDQSQPISLSDLAQGYCRRRNETEEWPLLPTGTQLDAIATLYAPVLFFHPLESSTLTSMDAVLQNFPGKVSFAGNHSILSDTIEPELLLHTALDYHSALHGEDYFIQHHPSSAFIAGDGYDLDTGRSRAAIYYNAFAPAEHVWVFNYWFYYPYRGSTSTSIITTSNTPPNNTVHWYNAQLRPLGEHQGDWQSLSVAVCPFSITTNHTTDDDNDTLSRRRLDDEEEYMEPLAVSYLQHGFREILDCTRGLCVLFENTTHPVGFVARRSHATYPVSAVHMIYTQWESNVLLHLRGVFGVDQTNYLRAADSSHDNNNSNVPYRYFLPNATNVLRHKNPSEIIFNGSSDRTTYWQSFPGRFGGPELWDENTFSNYNWSMVDWTEMELPFPTCTNANGTALVDCPALEEDETFHIFLQMVHANADVAQEVGQDLFRSLVSFWSSTTGQGSYGPATQPSFRQWMPGINAPIRNSIDTGLSSTDYCAALWIPDHGSPSLSTGAPQVSIRSNVIGICLTMTVLVFVNLSFILHPKLAAKSVPVLRFDPVSGMVLEPDGEQAWQTFRPGVIYALFYVVTMIGAALYVAGYVKLLDIAESALNVDLSSARMLATLFGLGVIVIDTFLVVFIWFPLRATWHQRWSLYYDLMGNDAQRNHYQRRIGRFCGRPARICFHIAYGALFNSLILAVLCVLIGAVDVGTAYIFGDFCRRLVTAADAICLDLHAWGIVIPCGAPLDAFCQAWSSRSSMVTLWGATIVVAGQYYLIDSCGAASAILKSFPCALKLLPNRQVYQQSVNQENCG